LDRDGVGLGFSKIEVLPDRRVVHLAGPAISGAGSMSMDKAISDRTTTFGRTRAILASFHLRANSFAAIGAHLYQSGTLKELPPSSRAATAKRSASGLTRPPGATLPVVLLRSRRYSGILRRMKTLSPHLPPAADKCFQESFTFFHAALADSESE
jgi:hypothetical protein